jgi:Family of unknown function (DUF6152)
MVVMLNHRNDVVGSLLRPDYLEDVRQRHHSDAIGDAEFKRIEDRGVRGSTGVTRLVCQLLGGWLVSVVAIAPLGAHHSIAAKFDSGKPVTLNGAVTAIDWANPHAHVFINVAEAGGRTANWAIELESTVDLQRSGWTRTSLKPGDQIIVKGLAARDGSKQAWSTSMVLAASGKPVFALSNDPKMSPPPKNSPAKPPPRWPDGQPRLGALPGETGYWADPSSSTLVENGVAIQADPNGLLRNIADAGKLAPFQPWARDLYVYRQRNSLKDDPMFLNCLPPGGPRQFQSRYGIQLLEDRGRQRIFVLMGGGNRNWRLIYTDGRAQRGQPQGDDNNPLYYGRAVGRWEQDTLVIDTKGFNERFWFSNGGLPHTDQLHLVERLSRSDFDTLRYEVTIDDPGAYTRTWSAAWTLRWIPGADMPEYFCQDNRP